MALSGIMPSDLEGLSEEQRVELVVREAQDSSVRAWCWQVTSKRAIHGGVGPAVLAFIEAQMGR